MKTQTQIIMAFGTFFKNLINGAKKVFTAAAPYIRKAIDIAPVVGNMVGGKVGNAITNTSRILGNVAAKGLGSNGAGTWKLPMSANSARFNVPALKYGS